MVSITIVVNSAQCNWVWISNVSDVAIIFFIVANKIIIIINTCVGNINVYNNITKWNLLL